MRVFKTLRPGDQGAEVRFLQRTLPSWTWPDLPAEADIDGIYGSRTQGAVTNYQTELDLAVDGIAGKETLTSLGIWANVTTGIDVSDHQGTINWPLVTGVSFAILKASEGGDFTASTFAANYKGARAQGLKVGAYHFARMGTNTPWKEAGHFLNVIGTRPLDLPACLDLEADFGIPADDALQWTFAWLEEVKRALGTTPIIYTSRNVTPRLAGGTGLETYPLWIPKWGPQPVNVNPWSNWNLWQYTSTGTVPGITGNVDLNYMVV